MRLLILLFSPATGTWGGLTRVIAIAEAAEKAGHSVAFCASGYLEATLRQRGYQVYTTPPTTMFGLPAPISRIIERRSQRMSLPVRPGKTVGNIWLVLVLSGMARAGYLRRVVKAEMRAAREFGADALFTDLDPGAFLLAAITKLPIASAYASIMAQGVGSWAWKLMQHAIAPVLKSHRLPPLTPDELCFGSSTLKIIPSIPELDGTDPSRPDVCYVGYLLGEIKPATPSDLKPKPGQRYVFVYVGTGSVSLTRLQNVLPQCFPANGDRMCVVSAQSVEGVQRLGAVEFRPYVPAEALLPHCDWTICHGGQNTIIQSLQHGVPLIIFPGPIFERRFNAQKVREAGAGLMGEMNEFTVAWLQATIEKHPEFAPKTAELGERICSYGGAFAAVNAIMSRVA
jgi:UDP:flavonoid glycosyltransferase YjiC (YdhE family)